MKKISYILFSLLGMVLATASCTGLEEENPVLKTPTKFVLNTPATANQYVDLGADKEAGTVNFTCSQPDYGFAASADYHMQVSLDESFAEYEELADAFNSCNMNVKCSQIAEAICKLRGIEDEDSYTDEAARKVFFRVRAQILKMEETSVVSNPVAMEKVKGYFALRLPGYIYLVGAHEGWTGPTEANKEHYSGWRLYESKNAIGSKIYTGVFEIPAGSFQFRFYTALNGWDNDSYGIQEADSPLDITMTDGIYSGALVKGKGSYNLPDWEGGSVKITVNMADEGKMSVKFEAGGVDVSDKAFIYLVGAPEGWAGPTSDNAAHYEDWKLYDMAGDGIYTGTFTIPAEKFQFRFYKELTGWDDASYGSQADDAPIDIELTDGLYTGPAVDGKGSWQIADWAEDAKVAITVNTKTGKVTFQKK